MSESPSGTLSCDLAIVGGGPGGLSAALAATEQGARVVLVEASSQLGGQYYRQLPSGWNLPSRRGIGSEQRQGAEMIGRLQASGCQTLTDCVVYDLNDHVLSCVHRGGPVEIVAAYVIVATGAYDLPVPLPGWTTPGVMTAGALHSLAAGQGVVPSGRILMAGNGPLVLKFTADLVHWGANVVCLVEAAEHPSLRRLVQVITAARHDVRRLVDGARYRAVLARRHVPLHERSVIVEIFGAERTSGAAFTSFDVSGRPAADAVQRVDCDIVCLGYGLVPSDELLELAGCEFAPPGLAGARVVETDSSGQTSLEWLYAVGDGVTVAGGPTALAAGTVAAEAVMQRLSGRQRSAGARASRASRALASHHRFQRAVSELYGTQLDLASIVTPETLLCRCEELTKAEVLSAAGTDAVQPLAAIRALTRAGMGPCQGRNCQRPIRSVLVGEGFESTSLWPLKRRVPARLVSVAAIAQPARGDLSDSEMTRDETTLPSTIEESLSE